MVQTLVPRVFHLVGSGHEGARIVGKQYFRATAAICEPRKACEKRICAQGIYDLDMDSFAAEVDKDCDPDFDCSIEFYFAGANMIWTRVIESTGGEWNT